MTGITIHPNTTVLVLNSSFEPLNLASGRRAIVLLLKEKAQMLSSRVIRLLNYVKVPLSRIVSQKPSRSMIYKRDGYKCQYCSSTRRLTIDHVVPKSKGGGESFNNLVVACSSCNTKKGNKLLEHTNMKLLRKPRAPRNMIEFHIMSSNNPEWKEYTFI
jgi:5-methylcytosine-specific restriction endonuclease McrA